jgi:signal transduction histidine kinase
MLRKIPAWLTDLAIAVTVAAITVGSAVHHHGGAGALLAAAGGVALLRRRQQPVLVLAVETALAVAVGHFWMVPAVVVAIWTVASRCDRRTSLYASSAAAAAFAVRTLVFGPEWNGVLSSTAICAVAWLLGDTRRAAELEREERTQQAAVDERARIARELHDVVTHNVSVMVVQAAAGNDVFDSRPERAREALRAIEETGRRALGEMRRLLDVEGGGDGTLPQPGLGRIDELVSNVRAAGLPVDLQIEGTPPVMPEGVDLSAYRILQEALTNTLRHARASRASVRVRYRNGAVELEVTDNGVGGAIAAGGRGIVGMRERVAVFGGDLDAGAQPGGGFAVRARMPLGAA